MIYRRGIQIAKLVLCFAAVFLFALSCTQQPRTEVTLTASDTPDPVPERASSKDFQAFSHQIPEHKQFACDTCHRREGNAIKSEFGGHESCIGCHLNQFIDKEDKTRAMCAVCHTDVNSNQPPVKAFPTKFVEGFNMHFDHAVHDSGEARPREGCVHCHTASGAGYTISIGIEAHNDCYGCHTAESKIGSCSLCHQLAPYTRTAQSNYRFPAIFTHGDHRSVGCAECHHVVAGVPNSRQVTNIAILEHRTAPGNNCLQCHNGRRAFTGNNPTDIRSCARCHGGAAFAKLPPGTYADSAPEAPAPEAPAADK